jgi:hypothetical protein
VQQTRTRATKAGLDGIGAVSAVAMQPWVPESQSAVWPRPNFSRKEACIERKNARFCTIVDTFSTSLRAVRYPHFQVRKKRSPGNRCA